MDYVANARMYAVNAAAKAAWSDLFIWVADRSGVPLKVIEHAFPAPLWDLWARPDLACAFMCGYPFARATARPVSVAAPVTTGSPVSGVPAYSTRLVVRTDSAFTTLADTFGGRLGYTVLDSQSGYNALRHHLLAFRTERRSRLYRESVGPLFTPRRVVDAVLTGAVDVGPVDSFALDLMLRHEPAVRDGLRVVATTEPAPMPLLVASAACPDEVVSAVRGALLAFGEATEASGIRDRLCLEGFATVRDDDYDLTLRWDAEAIAAGYPQPI